MAELRFENEVEEDGPFLLPRKSVEDLDHLITTEWSQTVVLPLEAKLKQEIDNEYTNRLNTWGIAERDPRAEELRIEAETAVRRFHRSETAKITLEMPRGRKLQVQSIAEAMNHPSVVGEEPLGFGIELREGNVNASIRSRWNSGIVVRATPEDSSEAQQFLIRARNWVDSNKPSWWIRRWRSLYHIQWFVFFGVTFLFLSSARASTSVIQQEAHNLLLDGISPDEQLRAIELLRILHSSRVMGPQLLFHCLAGSYSG